MDALGDEECTDCGLSRILAVISFGEAGYEGGFAYVRIAEDDHLCKVLVVYVDGEEYVILLSLYIMSEKLYNIIL